MLRTSHFFAISNAWKRYAVDRIPNGSFTTMIMKTDQQSDNSIGSFSYFSLAGVIICFFGGFFYNFSLMANTMLYSSCVSSHRNSLVYLFFSLMAQRNSLNEAPYLYICSSACWLTANNLLLRFGQFMFSYRLLCSEKYMASYPLLWVSINYFPLLSFLWNIQHWITPQWLKFR